MLHRSLMYATVATAVIFLTGCGMIGGYRGPESFGGKAYAVNLPDVRLARPVKIVLTVFKDDRPKNEHDLDWTRQASNYASKLGQPREVRTEFHRALTAGLSSNRKIQIVSPETFLQTKEADLVITGRVLRCEADRKMGWSDSYFVANSTMEIELRNGRGKQVWSKPIQFASKAEKPAGHSKSLDDIPTGVVSATVEESIAEVVQTFLASPDFSGALERSSRL